MPASLINHLNKLSKETLIELIVAINNEDQKCKSVVDTLMATHRSDALYAELEKEISAIVNDDSFVDYHEVNAFCKQLSSIVESIEQHLIPQKADLAIKLCQSLIEIDKPLFERINDPNDELGDFYYRLFGVLDTAFPHSSYSAKETINYIKSIYSSDDYGNRESIVEQLDHAFTPEVISQLKTNLPEPENLDDLRFHVDLGENWDRYKKNMVILKIHQKIADKENNIDRYIELSHLGGMNDQKRCKIAQRLNKQLKPDQAIEWLDSIAEHSQVITTKYALIKEAYRIKSGEQT